MLGKPEMSPGIVLMLAEVIMFNNISVVYGLLFIHSREFLEHTSYFAIT